MRKILFMTMALILLISVGCSRKDQGVSFTGNIEGDKVNISSEASGRVVDLKKDEGEAVKEGELVYVIDDTILKLQRGQVEKQVNALEVQLKIARDRGNKDGIKIAGYNLDASKKSLEIIDENIKRCRVLSPVSGVLSNLNFKIGENVQAGTQIFTVAKSEERYLKIYVPEKYLGNFNEKQKVEVKVPSLDNKVYEGNVVKIDDEGQFTPKNTETADEKSNVVYGVKISIKGNGELRPGMVAEVSING